MTHPDQERRIGLLRSSGSVFPERELAALEQAAADDATLDDLVTRRRAGTPIPYLVGSCDFGGIRLAVREGVFVPRPRTEFLARLAADRLAPGGSLLEIGCGAAPVAAFAAAQLVGLSVWAVDIDPAAVDLARENLPPTAVVRVAGSPGAIPDAPAFDVVAANLPYVPAEALAFMPREARDFEPLVALDGGDDGLDPLRAWVGGLGRLVRPGGSFLVEVATTQAEVASSVLREAVGEGTVRVHRSREHEATVVEFTAASVG